MSNQTKMELVPFDGRQIEVTTDDNHLVAMKSLVEGMGLSWKPCYDIIMNDEVLKSAMSVTDMPSAGGPQKMICLPMEYLNGFLFKLNPRRYKHKPELQAKLVQYQRECYKVLHQYFSKGYVIADWKKKELLRLCDEYQRMDERNRYLEQFAPNKDDYGKPGENGQPKIYFKRAYFASEGSVTYFSEVMSGEKPYSSFNLMLERLLTEDK